MADSYIYNLTALTAAANTDLVIVEHDPSGTPDTRKITVANLLKSHTGGLINGKISVTVASNDLTVAIKTLAGNDPSADDQVFVKIGTSIYTITSARSVTAVDGTNWAGRGGTMFAALEHDWFVYLGYNATDGVVIGFSPIPYARKYGDFSTTSTAETYCKISTITNASSNDPYTVIGRFAATLSAGAGYTWTVPTFTPSNLIQEPIYETRQLSWLPTFTNLTIGSGTLISKYKIVGKDLIYRWSLVFAADSSISGGVSHTIPMTRAIFTDVRPNALVRLYDASGTSYAALGYFLTSTTAALQQQTASGTYLVVGGINATVPFTWTTSDAIMVEPVSYPIAE